MIDIKNISAVRQNGAFALDSLSLEIKPRVKVAVLGANGAGKTTLLWAVMGLIPLAGGKIFLDGIEVEKRNLAKIRRLAGLVFQNSDDQLFLPTVLEDVMFGIRNFLGGGEDFVRERAEKVLAEFSILHLKDRRPQELSDGEKRKVSLCAVLACEPEILLLDEPSAPLDPRGRREFAGLLRNLDKTVLLTTHDLSFAEKVCEKCAVLRDGRLAAFGDTEKILSDEKLLLDCSLA